MTFFDDSCIGDCFNSWKYPNIQFVPLIDHVWSLPFRPFLPLLIHFGKCLRHINKRQLWIVYEARASQLHLICWYSLTAFRFHESMTILMNTKKGSKETISDGWIIHIMPTVKVKSLQSWTQTSTTNSTPTPHSTPLSGTCLCLLNFWKFIFKEPLKMQPWIYQYWTNNFAKLEAPNKENAFNKSNSHNSSGFSLSR